MDEKPKGVGAAGDENLTFGEVWQLLQRTAKERDQYFEKMQMLEGARASQDAKIIQLEATDAVLRNALAAAMLPAGVCTTDSHGRFLEWAQEHNDRVTNLLRDASPHADAFLRLVAAALEVARITYRESPDHWVGMIGELSRRQIEPAIEQLEKARKNAT